jgi:hypothetical protein
MVSSFNSASVTQSQPRKSLTRKSTSMASTRQPFPTLGILFLILAALFPAKALLVSSTSLSLTRNYKKTSLYWGTSNVSESDDNVHGSSIPPLSKRNRRRDCILHQPLLAFSSMIISSSSLIIPALADDVIPDGTTATKTDSGLKFLDLEPGGTAAGYGSDDTPQYGQLCVISYNAYMKLPAGKNTDKQKFDSTKGFVLKHGNGKMIAGLDEGLHTMKRGGLRRIIIPPKLGFVASGLGPLPEYPWQRFRLNSLLDEMIAQRGGSLIYDVRLERFFDDEADQGYYQDLDISPEEREQLDLRLLKRQKRGATTDALEAVGEDINISNRPKQKPIV